MARRPAKTEKFESDLKWHDLEEEIMKVWSSVDDVKALHWAFLDRPEHMTEDEVSNALLGIETLLQLRCEKLFNVYNQILRKNHERGCN
jgi:hypothetical protein